MHGVLASLIACLFAGVFWFGQPDEGHARLAEGEHPVKQAARLAPLTDTQAAMIARYVENGEALVPPPAAMAETVRVKRGQTLMVVLLKAGVGRTEAHNAVAAMRKLFNPRDLRQGTEIVIYRKASPESAPAFDGFEFSPSAARTIMVRLNADEAFTARRIDRTLEQEDIRISGKIGSSLYVDARKAGVPAEIIVEVIRLFSWDVDFQRDIHPGDGFDVLANRALLPDGSVADWGNVRFAALTLGGKTTRLYRFESKKNGVEYFDEKGKSAQKALMKTPINGARLSSRFGKRRHPILGYTKMHRGIDFASPRGTPIYAAGNGTVTYAGRKGGYGNYIRIRHNGRYSTAYAHMKGFRRGVRKGKRVRQGQVIGYVGSTGRSTGPHLHYEVLVKGRQVNPLRMKLPSGRKLQGVELASFRKIRDRVENRLAALAPVQKASLE